jgi:hypothetical protein
MGFELDIDGLPVPIPTSAPPVGKTDADLIKGNADDAKLQGWFDLHTIIGIKQARTLAQDSTDIKVLRSITHEKDFQTVAVAQLPVSAIVALPGSRPDFMGTLTLIPTGDDVTLDGMFGRACVEAMKIGATYVTVVKISHGTYFEGSKAGVDLGGMASGFITPLEDGAWVVSPGTTLGYSKAWASNESRPSMVIALFFDEGAVVKTDKGNDYHNTIQH